MRRYLTTGVATFGDRREEILEIEIDDEAPPTVGLSVDFDRARQHEAVNGFADLVKLIEQRHRSG